MERIDEQIKPTKIYKQNLLKIESGFQKILRRYAATKGRQNKLVENNANMTKKLKKSIKKTEKKKITMDDCTKMLKSIQDGSYRKHLNQSMDFSEEQINSQIEKIKYFLLINRFKEKIIEIGKIVDEESNKNKTVSRDY